MSLSRSALACAVFLAVAGCSLSQAAEPGKHADAATAAPSIESQFLSNMRQVTSGFTKAGEGYFSPDGKQIVYQAVSTDYPFYQIYTQPLQAAGEPFPKPKLISTGRGRTTLRLTSRPTARRFCSRRATSIPT